MIAAELRKAAETLRQRAEAATPGPWLAFQRNLGAQVNECTCSGPGAPYGHEYHCGIDGPIAEAQEFDISYIATMHPGIGLALATLLEETAEMWDTCGDPWSVQDHVSEFLDVARLINRGAA